MYVFMKTNFSDGRKKIHKSSTSSFLISSFTLAVVSGDCCPLASLINVDKKFRHFFTFSSVSCKQVQRNVVRVVTVTKVKMVGFRFASYCSDRCRSNSCPGGIESAWSLRDRSANRAGLHCGGRAQWLPWGGSASTQHDGVLCRNNGTRGRETSSRKITRSAIRFDSGYLLPRLQTLQTHILL